MSTNLLPLAPPARDVETSTYGRLALVSAVVSWTLASVRLGIAFGRHEGGVDPVLALGVVLGLPALLLLRWWSTIPRRVRSVQGGGATIVPFPPRRTVRGRRAS